MTLVWLFVACRSAAVDDSTAAGDRPHHKPKPDDDGPALATGDTGSTTDDTGDPGGTLNIDRCGSLPLPSPPFTKSTTLPASEEFTFDALGNFANYDASRSGFFLTAFGGTPVLLASYTTFEIAGIAMLHDGGLVACDEGGGSVIRIGPDGVRTVIRAGLNEPNSVAVDDRGFVFVTAYDQIWRLDPATGAGGPIETIPNADLDGLVFDPGFRTLYFNHDDGGTIGKLTLDESGNVTSSVVVTQIGAAWGSELDGMAMDACGNLYVTQTSGSVRRVRPDGTVEAFADLPAGANTTSTHFGSGIGGWPRDHLYVMDRYGGVFDLDAQIEGRWEPVFGEVAPTE